MGARFVGTRFVVSFFVGTRFVGTFWRAVPAPNTRCLYSEDKLLHTTILDYSIISNAR